MKNMPTKTINRNKDTPFSIRLWATGFETGGLSTIFSKDTKEYETAWITPDDIYFTLQFAKTEGEAKMMHDFWASKIENGFVPTTSLVDNFTIDAAEKFLEICSSEENKKHET